MTRMEALFDAIERSVDVYGYSISHFAFLNTSAAEHVEFRRRKLDEWFNEYATRHPTHAKELRQRIRSEDDEHHHAALHELHVHHLLVENGYETEPHPTLTGTTKRPEFAALRGGQRQFYVECTIVHGSPTTRRQTKFESAILDAINKVESPDYWLLVKFEEVDNANTPATSAIIKSIERKIAESDCETVRALYKSTGELPSIAWQQNGWKLTVELCPKNGEALRAEDRKYRNIGTIIHPVRSIDLDSKMNYPAAQRSGYQSDVWSIKRNVTFAGVTVGSF